MISSKCEINVQGSEPKSLIEVQLTFALTNARTMVSNVQNRGMVI